MSDERAAFEAFLRDYPEYAATGILDELRRTEYRRLDEEGHVYLDYTGASLYAESQLREHLALLSRGVFGNPHSASVTSTAATDLVEHTRRAVLDWFNASPGEYTAVFTANCTGALKHVAESFPFRPGGRLLMTFDNHNSVNGIREFAGARGACIDYAPLTTPELRIDRERLEPLLERADPAADNLFVFPAQSNFSGVQHPLDLVAHARARGWAVALDAAAFVPTSRLDLADVPADFVTISFYKMFGYPTAVGCLIARHEALDRLCRPWFAGGTVNFATVQGTRHVLAPREGGFEDGTLNFLSIPAVEIGLRHLQRVGLDTINTRVRSLAGWLLSQLVELRHANGRRLVRIYGPETMEGRGATLTMNFYDPEGHLLDYRRVEEMAGAQRISLRTGCFCNPGVNETAEGLTDEDLGVAFATRPDMTLPLFLQIMTRHNGKSAGAIRASFGVASTFGDAWRFLQFAAALRDQARLKIGAVTFEIETCRVIRDGS